MKNKKNSEKKTTTGSTNEQLEKYSNAPYFKEKDRKAKEFLQKHPIPEKFLK